MNTEKLKDLVYYELTMWMDHLREADYCHRRSVLEIFEMVDYTKFERYTPAVVAGGILSIAFQVFPENYSTNSKPWAVMHVMQHRALYERILKAQKELKKQIDIGLVHKKIGYGGCKI